MDYIVDDYLHMFVTTQNEGNLSVICFLFYLRTALEKLTALKKIDPNIYSDQNNRSVFPAHITELGVRTGTWGCSHPETQVGFWHVQYKSSIQGHPGRFILGEKEHGGANERCLWADLDSEECLYSTG